MTTISILGTGWLGLPLALHLASSGFEVKGSTRSPERTGLLSEKGIHPFVVNLATGEYGPELFYDAEILVVNIPFKGIAEFSGLIKAIEKSSIARVIFVSSTSVYGNKEGVLSEEDHGSLLPCALLEIEALFTSNKAFSTTVVRFGGLIGYRRNPALFFKNNRSVPKPESTVNMIHRDDCINIISLIIEKQAWGHIFNACSDSHPTKRAFYTHAATVSGVSIPSFSDDHDRAYKKISSERVKRALAYTFVHSDLLALKGSDIT